VARLKFKLEINPGGHGVRLDKLGKISDVAERFFRSLVEDSGATLGIGDLVASDFYDSSFGSTVEAVRDVAPEVVATFDIGIEFFSAFDGEKSKHIPANLTSRTIKRFVELGEQMESDEAIKIGLFKNGDASPRWEKLTKASTVLMKNVLEAPYYYKGSLQGNLGTWYKESSYFNLREMAGHRIVKCHYQADMYPAVYAAFEDREAVVHVIGDITAERLSGDPTDMSVSELKIYPRLSDSEFNSIASSVPDFLSDESVISYLDRTRRDADD
jgi:hypothetical protein